MTKQEANLVKQLESQMPKFDGDKAKKENCNVYLSFFR